MMILHDAHPMLAWGPLHWVDAHVLGIAFWAGLCSTALLWWAFRVDDRRALAASIAAAALAALAVGAAWLTTTPAEHGEERIATLVQAAVAGDGDAMRGCFAPDATWHLGTEDAPPGDAQRIHRAIERITAAQRVQSNIVTLLGGTTLDDDSAFVELACLTETAQSTGLVATRWEFEVRRQPDGGWRIARIIWVRLMGETPNPGIL